MKIHLERKESDEQLLSSCLQKQQQKPTWKELNVPSFLFFKPAYIFLELENRGYNLKLARKMNITPSYLCKVLLNIEKEGLIKRIKEGRTCYLSYTEKGKKLRSYILGIFKVFGIEK